MKNLQEKLELHNSLNPKIWEDNELKPSVKDKIIEIVDQFQEDLDYPIDIVDIRIVGSNASYNYTEFSDLDIHLVVNMELMDMSQDVSQIFFNLAKTNFNNKYDISIKGINAELYVEDVNSTAITNGIYSIYQQRWVKFPKKIVPPDVDISKELVIFTDRIHTVLSKGNINSVTKLINDLYIMRKDSLDSAGEYGKGNQLFKELRNQGLLDDLKSKLNELKSKELSLEQLQRM